MERASSVPTTNQSSRARRRTVRCCTCNTRRKRRDLHELPGGWACNDLGACLARLRASTGVITACYLCDTEYFRGFSSGDRLVNGVGLCFACQGRALRVAGLDTGREDYDRRAPAFLRQLARMVEAGAMPRGAELLFLVRRLGATAAAEDLLNRPWWERITWQVSR